MEALRIEGLSKDFGGIRAVHDVSFSVGVGERLAIIGPNGAGKSTLFNVINGQLSPTAGRVYAFGKDITHMPTYRQAHLGIAHSFQITSLFINLTVLQNVLLALQGTQPSRFHVFRPIHTYEDVLARAEELLAEWGLLEKRDEPVRNISYGEQRKLEIALTVAPKPKLLLMDEPSTGLTAAEGADIIDKMRKLGREITVVLVAHDMDLVFGMADRIIVLHYGQIIAEGKPEAIQADSRVKEIYMGIEESASNA